ncbi:DNA cytosine methyltransferase [Lyngbya sp. PCC 8106]|uniref:DNA cytosine methyltransferase n=1 Tax=Lyngbya sp. (strain PCC 8106) TaxID=313612 RepID=UPI0000EAA013|nr:DNA cytosine methyltransferase [Lyngbya sp. PCC 8106]EAW38015.1 modification methylase [Lyngbya sp. PCC 8106]
MRVVDLFAGCGGLSLGLQQAGFNIVAAFDDWESAIKVYQKNFAHPIFSGNLQEVQTAVDLIKPFSPNVIVGGPPCQDFSSAGKRDENLGRGDLTLAFSDIITRIKPQWFILENVELFKKSRQYSQAKALFEQSGYGLTEKVFDASLCGVPQKRKRFFWVGELNGKDNRLLSYFESKLSSKPTTVRDYLGDKLGLEYYYRHPRSYQRRGIFSIDEPSPTVRGVNRPIPKTYQKHPKDPVEITPNLRPLTTLERSYIQTFPETFIFEGSKTDLEQMIGNAVPVKLAEFVGKCMIESVENSQLEISKSESDYQQLSLNLT